MEVTVNKKQMKEIIKNHYWKLGARNLAIKIETKKENLSLLERDYNNGGLDYYINHSFIVTGKIENEGKLHDFWEKLSASEIVEIVKANFDKENYNIHNVEFNDGFRPTFFSTESLVVPYCKGMVVTMEQKRKNKGKYIVKK